MIGAAYGSGESSRQGALVLFVDQLAGDGAGAFELQRLWVFGQAEAQSGNGVEAAGGAEDRPAVAVVEVLGEQRFVVEPGAGAGAQAAAGLVVASQDDRLAELGGAPGGEASGRGTGDVGISGHDERFGVPVEARTVGEVDVDVPARGAATHAVGNGSGGLD